MIEPMETSRVIVTRFPRASVAVALASLTVLTGCSSVNNLLAGEKIDYKSSTTRDAGLEIPPDLTQLSRESRYQQQSGSVSATAFQARTAATGPQSQTTAVIAPRTVGDFHIERQGNVRWLTTNLPPEQVYPLVRSFWKDNGFNIDQDRAEAGIVETDWAENRAKLPNDFIRNTVGKVFDSAFSTGELDKFNTRVERTAAGSDIFVTHRGMVEVYVGDRRERTVWQPRPPDPALEAEFLARMMVKLGGTEEQAKSALVAVSAPVGPPRARVVEGSASPTLRLDDGFDGAWRRVGVALDRSGFTVEDRDRKQGVYFVRYVDPAYVGRAEPGFFSRLFDFGKKKDDRSPQRYRVQVTGDGPSSTVAVLDSQGGPETGAAGKRIFALLFDDLK